MVTHNSSILLYTMEYEHIILPLHLESNPVRFIFGDLGKYFFKILTDLQFLGLPYFFNCLQMDEKISYARDVL